MLKITWLSKTYDNGVHALRGVNLDIPKGMYGLLGPNGAGKSSLMRTIATLQSADSGSIEFDGINVLEQPKALRERLGYLPQDFGVYPRVSAYDLLDHIALFKADPDDINEGENMMYLQKHSITTSDNVIKLKVRDFPKFAGIDPFVKLIDKETGDNIKSL